jgi:hypothetical protein
MVLVTLFAIVVLAGVGKLIYDVQSRKKSNPTKTIEDFEFKDDFQKLAGIKPIYGNDEIREIIVKNNLDAKEQIVEALLKAAKNGEFPKQDESINMGTTKIGTIHTNFGDNDPLASVPMSRVSKAAKQKMAEIAKQDITARLEETAEKYAKLIPEQKKCGCGRSETGYCTGLHTIPKKQWETGMTDLEAYAKAANPATKPKRKYKKKPKA